MSIDPLLDRVYNRRTYNCFHFAADAWRHITGEDTLDAVFYHSFGRNDLVNMFKHVRRVPGPTVGASIVLMENRIGDRHIGICYQGRLLHLSEQGVQYMPFDAYVVFYRNMRFYQ